MVHYWISPLEEAYIAMTYRHEDVERNQQDVIQNHADRDGLQEEYQSHFFVRVRKEFQHAPCPEEGANNLKELNEQVYHLISFVI